MWAMSIPITEIIIRGAIVYGFLLVSLRLSGKRQISQLAPFDFVLLLVLSNAVQNSMNGGDNSLIGGLISAATLMTLNFIISLISYRSRRLAKLIEGSPSIIIHNGRLRESVLARERLSKHDLDSALRAAGCPNLKDVHYAILETSGSVTVIKKSDTNLSTPATDD
jgi:uncharacterized membrane protein YcaP (DUF421 family)